MVDKNTETSFVVLVVSFVLRMTGLYTEYLFRGLGALTPFSTTHFCEVHALRT